MEFEGQHIVVDRDRVVELKIEMRKAFPQSTF